MPNHSHNLLNGHILLRSHFGLLYAPSMPHISPNEGGHIFATLNRPIVSRIEADARELLDLDYMSIVAAKCLARCYEADWFNFQENGNWSLGRPEHVIHLHIYGRKRDSFGQPFGEALRFPKFNELDSWKRTPYRHSQVQEMKDACGEIASEGWASEYLSIINSDS